MRNLCPCRDCRPQRETLRQAIRRINKAAEVARYGVEGAARREADKLARLAALREGR